MSWDYSQLRLFLVSFPSPNNLGTRSHGMCMRAEGIRCRRKTINSDIVCSLLFQVEPVGSKTKELILGAPLKCPTEVRNHNYTIYHWNSFLCSHTHPPTHTHTHTHTQESPYFYTRKNSGLNANFHAEQSNSGGDTGAGEGNNLRTILLGTSVSLFVVLVVGGAVIGVVVWRRRRRRRQQNWGLTVSTDGEKVSLVTKWVLIYGLDRYIHFCC